MVKRLTKRLVAIFAAAVFSAGAQAADGGYFGIGVGSSDMKDADTALLAALNPDKKDTAFKLFVGYLFNPNFGIELAYVDFGEFTDSTGGVTFERWAADAVNVSAIGKIPVSNVVSFFGKAGLAFWNVDNDIDIFSYSASESGADISYGVGTEFNFGNQVGARIEWEQFTDVGDEAMTGKSDIDMISASLIFRF